MNLQLTLACGDYDRTHPLIDGIVQPEGISWKITAHLSSPERHHEMLVNQAFDVSELSLASYFISRERMMNLRAIPVFPHRHFRHGYIFINRNSGIHKPSDLAGKRVGVRRFQNTASVWVRGILADEYGIDRRSIKWFTEGDEEIPVTPPAWLSCARIPKGKTLDDLLAAGELDAAIYPEVIPSLSQSAEQVCRLFPNYKQVEIDYYKRTGLYPLMHTVVVKGEILDRHPWVAASVWKAFQQAKLECYKYLSDPRRSSLGWFRHAWEEQIEILGADPWPYDLELNRHALETLCRYLVDDGLLARAPTIEEAFVNV